MASSTTGCRICDKEVAVWVTVKLGGTDLPICLPCAAKLKAGVTAVRDAAILAARAYAKSKAPHLFEVAGAAFRLWQMASVKE